MNSRHLGSERAHHSRRLQAGRGICLDGNGGKALPAPDQRRLEDIRELSHLLQRYRFAAGNVEHKAAQGVELRALLRNRAGHDVDEVDAVAHLRHARARQDSIDGLAQGLRADAERTGAILIHLDADDLRGLVPVEVDVARVRGAAEHRRELVGQLAHFRRIWSGNAELERPANGRSELERAHPRHHLLELGPLQRGQDALLHAGAHFEALGDHDRLREEVVGELLVERQVKADRAAADIERPTLDVGVGLQDGLEIIHHFARRIDGRPLGQRDIDEELWTIGTREELLLHELHAEKCRKEETHGSGNHGVFLAQGPIEHGAESALKARRLMADGPSACREE